MPIETQVILPVPIETLVILPVTIETLVILPVTIETLVILPMPIVMRKSYKRSSIPRVGQYGEIFHSRPRYRPSQSQTEYFTVLPSQSCNNYIYVKTYYKSGLLVFKKTVRSSKQKMYVFIKLVHFIG